MPWRYYLSQCIQNEIFPYWNPYQQLGYPIHADLQGPVWYFESWLLSMFTVQDPVTLQRLFTAYVALAGLGMYALSFYLIRSIKAAWCVGVAYMLGGFFVSHSQHFYSIISAAWLPFIVLNFLRLMQLRQLRYGLYTSVFLFFTLTGGNHTFAFFTAYLLFVLTLFYLFQSFKSHKETFWLQIKLLGITVLLTAAQVIMLATVYFQVQPYISRLSGLSYESCIANSFTWQACISFLQPFATSVEWDFFNTDPSMSNHYFGILLLPLSLLFLSKIKSSFEKILAVFASFCLIMSFGDATPVYKIMYNFLPGINLFRFISYFGFMFTFCLLLLAGNTISYYLLHFQKYKKRIIRVFSIFSVLLLLLLICSIPKSNVLEYIRYFTIHNLFERASFGNKYDHLIFQGLIQCVLFLVLIAIYFLRNKWVIQAFMILLAIDLFIAVQLNIANVCVGDANPKALNDYVETLPGNFDCPPDEALLNFNEEKGQKFGLYRNTACFHHWISDSYHNSFVFSGKTNLYFEKPKLHEAILKNHLFYASNALFSESKLIQQINAENLQRKIFLEEKTLNKLSRIIGITDTLIDAEVILQEVKPNRLQAQIVCNRAVMLHCIQSYYKGWHAFIDDEETEIYKSNGLLMSIAVPEGKHRVNFIYRNYAVIFSGITGYVVFFVVLFYITFYNRNHYFYKYFFGIFWLLFLIILIQYFAK